MRHPLSSRGRHSHLDRNVRLPPATPSPVRRADRRTRQPGPLPAGLRCRPQDIHMAAPAFGGLSGAGGRVMKHAGFILILLLLAGCGESMDRQNRLKTYGAPGIAGWPGPSEALPLPPGVVARDAFQRDHIL